MHYNLILGAPTLAFCGEYKLVKAPKNLPMAAARSLIRGFRHSPRPSGIPPPPLFPNSINIKSDSTPSNTIFIYYDRVGFRRVMRNPQESVLN